MFWINKEIIASSVIMVLILYLDLLSQPCRALYITLKLFNIPFKCEFISIGNGEHLTEEFTKNISRFNKLPVINDNGFKLTESIGILKYLAKTRNIKGNYYPQDAQIQARIDEYLEWQHLNVRFICSLYFFRKFVSPKLYGKISPPEKLKLCFDKMENCLDNVEALWLNGGPYITGDQLTAADVWAACEIEQLTAAGYDPKVGRPKLAAFLERVRHETNPYYDEAHKEIYQIVEMENKRSKL
ncbi:GstT1 [Trypoxylus dichotomus]